MNTYNHKNIQVKLTVNKKQIIQSQKVSSCRTLVGTTSEVFKQNQSYKLELTLNFHAHIFSGYSLSMLTNCTVKLKFLK